MRTEEEIREKINFIEKEQIRTRNDFLNDKIDLIAFKSQFLACTCFIDAFNWVLDEDAENE